MSRATLGGQRAGVPRHQHEAANRRDRVKRGNGDHRSPGFEPYALGEWRTPGAAASLRGRLTDHDQVRITRYGTIAAISLSISCHCTALPAYFMTASKVDGISPRVCDPPDVHRRFDASQDLPGHKKVEVADRARQQSLQLRPAMIG
jgi:hypothetical protein